MIGDVLIRNPTPTTRESTVKNVIQLLNREVRRHCVLQIGKKARLGIGQPTPKTMVLVMPRRNIEISGKDDQAFNLIHSAEYCVDLLSADIDAGSVLQR